MGISLRGLLSCACVESEICGQFLPQAQNARACAASGLGLSISTMDPSTAATLAKPKIGMITNGTNLASACSSAVEGRVERVFAIASGRPDDGDRHR